MGNNTPNQSRRGNQQTPNPPPPAQATVNTQPFIQKLPAARGIVRATQHSQSAFRVTKFQPAPIARQSAADSPAISATSTDPSSFQTLQGQITSWFAAQDIFMFDIGVKQFVSFIQISIQDLYSRSDVGIRSYLNAVNNGREGYHPFFIQPIIDALATHICRGRRVYNHAQTDTKPKLHNGLQLRMTPMPLPHPAALFRGFFLAGTCDGMVDLQGIRSSLLSKSFLKFAGWITNWFKENSIFTLDSQRAAFLSCVKISNQTLLSFSEKEIQEYFEIINDLTDEPFLEQRLIDALAVEVCWARWMHKLQQDEVMVNNTKNLSFGEDENASRDKGENASPSRDPIRDPAPDGEWHVVKGQRRGKSKTKGRGGRISRSGREKDRVLYLFSKVMKSGGSKNGRYYHSIKSQEDWKLLTGLTIPSY